MLISIINAFVHFLVAITGLKTMQK